MGRLGARHIRPLHGLARRRRQLAPRNQSSPHRAGCRLTPTASIVPLAAPTGARALKGPSPPQKRLPSARFVPSCGPLPRVRFRVPRGAGPPAAAPKKSSWAMRKLCARLAGPGRTAHAHSLTVPSADPVAKVRPSGPTATEQTAEVWPWKVARHSREATSHALAILSSEPVMSAAPS